MTLSRNSTIASPKHYKSKDSSSYRVFHPSDRNKITFIGAGLVEIVAAAGVFIKKENILDLVPVYVFCGQKVIGD